MKSSKAMMALATMMLMSESNMYGRNQQSNFKVEPDQSNNSQVWKRKKCKSCLNYKEKGKLSFCSFGGHKKPTSKACNQYKRKK